jgi:hypothetical protein
MTNDKDDTGTIYDPKKDLWVFKANVPLEDAEYLKDWNATCQATSPEGFDDYRWGKIKYDHQFVKNFKPLVEKLVDELRTMNEKLMMLDAKLEMLKVQEKVDEDFKGLMKGKK